MKHCTLLTGAFVLAGLLAARAEIKITVNHNEGDKAKPEFKFETVPAPSKDDAAATAKFTIVEGERDSNGAEVSALNDGKLPGEEDQPDANFFFDAGTEGGRVQVDLGDVVAVKQVNTYSWHANTRGPQVYKLYASDGKAEGFNARPKKGTDPEKAGWKLVAKVNTKPKGAAEGGGQYGVSIADSEGALGKYRYLLFDIVQTEDDDSFGNTFYSEIDVVAEK
jgi:hypothetical protein